MSQEQAPKAPKQPPDLSGSEIESYGTDDNGKSVYAWIKLANGRTALWTCDFRQPPGKMQGCGVVEC